MIVLPKFEEIFKKQILKYYIYYLEDEDKTFTPDQSTFITNINNYNKKNIYPYRAFLKYLKSDSINIIEFIYSIYTLSSTDKMSINRCRVFNGLSFYLGYVFNFYWRNWVSSYHGFSLLAHR